MALARIFLRLMAAMSVFFGVIYAVMPGPMLDAAGFGSVLPGGVTDIRATYGGLQIGMGAFCFWSSQAEARVRGALLLVVFSVGALGACRSLGLMFDGNFNAFHWAGLVTETVITIMAMIVMVRLPDEEQSPVKPPQ